MQAPNGNQTAPIALPDEPFETREPLGGDTAEVRFSGHFDGDAVVWNARIETLARVARTLSTSDHESRPALRRFIEIGGQTADGRLITIGLDAPAIDAATVLKTVTMIRNYKRLRIGRIEWGPEYRGQR